MKSAPTTPRLADRYIRCDDFIARIDGVELAPEIWAVFAQLAQSRTELELAQQLKLDPAAVGAAIRRLVRRKLVRKHVLAWRDYAVSQELTPVPATVAASDTTRPPFGQRGFTPVTTPSATGMPSLENRSTACGDSQSTTLSFRISASRADAPARPVLSLRIDSPGRAKNITRHTVSPMQRPTAEGLKLRPVLDAIGAKAGGGIAGQLLVYRVFLQIPTSLMQAAGLHSLSLVDDHYIVRHPELRAALADTARRHAGVDIEAVAA